MKIDFTPKDFLRLFKLAAGVASTKYITPILQNVKIVADKQNGAILMATNLEIGIRVRLDVHVSESGEALLLVKTLRTILDFTKEPTLTMERTQDGKVVVYGANERHELCTQDPDEFPNAEEFDASDYFELGVDNVQTLLNRTIFAVDNKDGRPRHLRNVRKRKNGIDRERQRARNRKNHNRCRVPGGGNIQN